MQRAHLYNSIRKVRSIDSTDHEKTSYVTILGGKDVIGDDYDVGNCCDFVKASMFSYFKEKNEKDVKDCVEDEGDQVDVSNF